MSFEHLISDLETAWAAIRFVRPDFLLLFALLPAFAVLGWWSSRRRRCSLSRIAQPGALYSLRTPVVWGRGGATFAYPMAWALLVLGIAGPRWGRSEEGGLAVGRDVVILLDMSRSMLASDMNGPVFTRFHAAKVAALDLLESISRRGGHRVGLVVFATKPAVLCPLTTDYDHVRAVLDGMNGRYPPPECRPGLDLAAVSGTRIGAALSAAVGVHDSRFPGSQDIVLLSDGDDPVTDLEWRRGADGARNANIPVHTVGFGDPEHEKPIFVGDELLEFSPIDGGPAETVQTRLHEEPLRSIAEETRGQYVPARQSQPPLGEYFRTQIEPHPSREVSDDAIPQMKERFAWFLAPALLLFTFAWLRGQ